MRWCARLGLGDHARQLPGGPTLTHLRGCLLQNLRLQLRRVVGRLVVHAVDVVLKLVQLSFAPIILGHRWGADRWTRRGAHLPSLKRLSHSLNFTLNIASQLASQGMNFNEY